MSELVRVHYQICKTISVSKHWTHIMHFYQNRTKLMKELMIKSIQLIMKFFETLTL